MKHALVKVADVTLTMKRDVFNQIVSRQTSLDQVLEQGQATLMGDGEKLKQFMASFDKQIFADRVAIR